MCKGLQTFGVFSLREPELAHTHTHTHIPACLPKHTRALLNPVPTLSFHGSPTHTHTLTHTHTHTHTHALDPSAFTLLFVCSGPWANLGTCNSPPHKGMRALQYSTPMPPPPPLTQTHSYSHIPLQTHVACSGPWANLGTYNSPPHDGMRASPVPTCACPLAVRHHAFAQSFRPWMRTTVWSMRSRKRLLRCERERVCLCVLVWVWVWVGV